WTAALARRAVTDIAATETPPGALRREVLRYAGLASFQVILAIIVWRRSEFLFLDRYAGDSEIALYSIAYAATNALTLIPVGIASVLIPAVSTLHGAGETDRIRIGFARALRLMLTLTFPL